jgi:hypothetical protein
MEGRMLGLTVDIMHNVVFSKETLRWNVINIGWRVYLR